jgi:hypothetical protein
MIDYRAIVIERRGWIWGNTIFGKDGLRQMFSVWAAA